MKNFDEYKSEFIKEAQKVGMAEETMEAQLFYALNLFDKGLPIIYDVKHLAAVLGYKETLLYKISNSPRLFYRKFKVPKKRGGSRVISEPLPTLKEIQNWILKEILNNVKVHPCAKAFKKKSSIVSNAKFHRNQKVLLSIDIESFFPSVNIAKVYYLFKKLGYYKSVAFMLAKLCCLEDKLPQGSPTSPSISNLIFYQLDNRIFNYCNRKHIRYTRYADDLSFSGDFDVDELHSFLMYILEENGFRINRKKTKIMRQHDRQTVTGLVVNNVLQTEKTYRKEIRKAIYYIKKFGVNNHLERIGAELNSSQYINSLYGKVAFILSVDKTNREFLLYKELLGDLSKGIR